MTEDAALHRAGDNLPEDDVGLAPQPRSESLKLLRRVGRKPRKRAGTHFRVCSYHLLFGFDNLF